MTNTANTPSKPKTPVSDRIYDDGNIFFMMGVASSALRRHGRTEDRDEMMKRIQSCGSYDQALSILFEYVEVVD